MSGLAWGTAPLGKGLGAAWFPGMGQGPYLLCLHG